MIGAGLIGQQRPAVRRNDHRCRPDRAPSQPWPALDQLHFTAPTERTLSRGSASNGQPFITTMIGGLEGLRSLAAVAGPGSTPFHGADGADALQGLGQQWPAVHHNDDRGRPGGLRSLAATASRSSQRSSVHAWRAAVPRSRGRP